MQDYSVIDVENSINSGQVFLWRKDGNYWYGVNGQDILQVYKTGKIKSFQGHKTDFFRKKDDLEEIIKTISKDKTTKTTNHKNKTKGQKGKQENKKERQEREKKTQGRQNT